MPMSLDRGITNVEEVSAIIKNLNNKKSTGPDGLPVKCFKCLPHIGLKQISYIFNAIFRLSHFPSQWKKARVILIAKPGKDPHLLTSYRPISILSIFSKIFERILLARIRTYIETPNHQFGFRLSHGCPEQCPRIVDFVRKSFEEKEYVCAVFLDVRQAFDKVWHLGLLYKIKKQFPPFLYVLVKSYIENRSFFVQINDKISSVGAITAGVPQGSVIAPTLYTIFTSDLPDLPLPGLNATFADDTAFAITASDPVLASQSMQIHLDKYINWSRTWNIGVNEGKSVQVTFSMRKGNCPPLQLNNKTIEHVDNVKYLGLHLDRRLTFSHHISQKKKQLNTRRRQLYGILRSESGLSLDNKLLIYKTCLKPVLMYCAPLWGMASNSNIKKLEAFQPITLRVMTGLPNYVSNEEIRRDLNLNTISTEIINATERYKYRLEAHPNNLAANLIYNRSSRFKIKKFFQ